MPMKYLIALPLLLSFSLCLGESSTVLSDPSGARGVNVVPTEGIFHVKQLSDINAANRGITLEALAGGTCRLYHTDSNTCVIQKGSNANQLVFNNSGWLGLGIVPTQLLTVPGVGMFGVANVSETLLGMSANTSGHEGVSLHHDGTQGYLTSVDAGVAWHDITYGALVHKFEVAGTTTPLIISNTGVAVDSDLLVSSANGRVWGLTGLAAGHTVNFQFGGDANNTIETTWGQPTTFKSYHGTVIQNTLTGSPSGPALIVQGRSTRDIQRWHAESGATAGVMDQNGRLSLASDVVLSTNKATYHGDPDTDGSWRHIVIGGNMTTQLRESGAWVTKQTITP